MSSRAGGGPHAAPYMPAAVPAAAPMWQRTSNGRGMAASRPILPTASVALAALTGARRAGPALATTP
eukprot:8512985-Lingulodinium_polyedra.AAC.1